MKSRLEVNQVTHTGSIRKLEYAFYLLSVLFLCFCVHRVWCVLLCVCAKLLEIKLDDDDDDSDDDDDLASIVTMTVLYHFRDKARY